MDPLESNRTGKDNWVLIEKSPTETDDARMERHFGFLQIGRICPDPIEYYLTLTAESVASLAATQPHETRPTYKQEPSRAAIEKIAGALQAVKDERTAIVREMNNATLEKLALTLGIVEPWKYISANLQNVSGFDPRIPPVLEELHERIKFMQRRRQESEDQAEDQAEKEIVHHTGLPLPTFPITLHHAIKLAVKGHNVHKKTLIKRFGQFCNHCVTIPCVFDHLVWDPHAREFHDASKGDFAASGQYWDYHDGILTPAFIVADQASPELALQQSFDAIFKVNHLVIPECLFGAFLVSSSETFDWDKAVIDRIGLEWLIRFFYPFYEFASGVDALDAEEQKTKKESISHSNSTKANPLSTLSKNRDKMRRLAELAAEFSAFQSIPEIHAELEEWGKAFSDFLKKHNNPGIKVSKPITREKLCQFIITMSMRKETSKEVLANNLRDEGGYQVDSETIGEVRRILWPKENEKI